MWLARCLRVNALNTGSKVALKDENRSYTYKELDQRTNALYDYFRTVGLKRGDRVAVLSKNSVEVIETFVCCYKSGLIFVPLNYRLSPDQLNYVLRDCGVGALVVSKEYAGLVSSGLLNTNDLKSQVVCTEPFPGMQCYDELMSNYSSETFDVKINDKDPAAIIYTSGTTGHPKGVILSHRALLEVAKNFCFESGIEPTDRTLVIMPLFHSGGHGWTLAHLCRGATGVVMPNFNAQEVLEVMAREQISTVHFVPTMIAMLLEEPKIASYDLSSLKTILYAGSPIPLPLLKKAMGVFGEGKFVQAFGQTEHGPNISCLSREEHVLAVQEGSDERVRNLLKSCGRPVFNVEVRIMQDGREVPRGTIGEITARGESMMDGYWNKPDLTEQKIKNGWLYTGDLGKMDEDGYIYLVDRKEDMIITGGENVYPAEVENVLYEHPAVAEAAVFGLQDEKWGERTVAAVTLKNGLDLKEEELIEWCRERVAGYARPRQVFLAKELPKTGSGKISRSVLREMYQPADPF